MRGAGRGAGLDHLLTLAEGNLPFLAARRGDLLAAFIAYRRAESSLFGYPERLATMRCDLAEALIAAHLPGEARVLLDLAVPELTAAGAEVALSEARLLLAQVELRTGDPCRARENAELAATGLAAQGRTLLAPLATEILLRARLMLGPPSGELLAEMLACADALDGAGHPNASAALRFTAADVSLQLGDRPAADEQLAVSPPAAGAWWPARRRRCGGRWREIGAGRSRRCGPGWRRWAPGRRRSRTR